MKSPRNQHLHNPTRLVWLICLLGCLAGAVMVAIVWWTLLDVRTARQRFDTYKTQAARVRAQIDQRQVQEKWELYNLLQGNAPAGLENQTSLPGLIVSYRRIARDPELSGVFQRLELAASGLEELRRECLSWERQSSESRSRLPLARSEVEQALSRMDEAVEKAYGQQRLNRAIRIQQYRRSSPPQASELAREIIGDLASAPDLSVIRRDLADLALLIERLQGEKQVDFLADLKDNRLRTVLARLHRTIRSGNIKETAGSKGLTEELLVRFEIALFGEGYFIEDDHQTIIPGIGGMYGISADRLRLENEREKLQLRVASRFDEIGSALQNVSDRVDGSLENEAREVEGTLQLAWRTMLLILAGTIMVFLLISSRIISAVKRQIKAIEETNFILDARTKALLASREELTRSEVRLRHLSRSLLTAQESERRRISLELHDELGQSLAALKLQVRTVERSLGKEAPPALRSECEYLRQDINQIIENVRRLSRDLSPVVLEDLGFEAAVRYLVNSFAKLYQLKIDLRLEEVSHLISQESQRNIYRILQELLNNIGKHAAAREVSIVIEKREEQVNFLVRDDGRGFDLEETKQRGAAEKGMGLAAVAERVRILGGSLDIRSEPGSGSTINFTAPI